MGVPALNAGGRGAFARGFFVASSLFLSPLVHGVTAPVEATPGTFAVNEDGELTFGMGRLK